MIDEFLALYFTAPNPFHDQFLISFDEINQIGFDRYPEDEYRDLLAMYLMMSV